MLTKFRILILISFCLSSFAQQFDWNKQIKNKPFVDVLDGGVVGDGSTDNTAKLQTIINNNPTAFIFFRCGNYRINSTITISTAVKLIGADRDCVTISSIGTPSSLFYTVNSTRIVGFRFSNFTINLTGNTTTKPLDLNKLERSTVDHVRIKGAAYGLYIWNDVVWSHFEHIVTTDPRTYGVYVNGDVSAENFFTDVNIQRETAGTTDGGFVIGRSATSADMGAHYLTRVRVTRVGSSTSLGDGFLFINTNPVSAQAVVKMSSCVSDNVNNGHALKMIRFGINEIHASWFFNTDPSKASILLDESNDTTFTGNVIGSNSGPAVEFANSSYNISFSGNRLVPNSNVAFYMPATNPPTTIYYGRDNILAIGTLTNDLGRFSLASGTRNNQIHGVSILSHPNGGKEQALGIFDSVNQKGFYIRNENGYLTFLPDSFSSQVATLTEAGDWFGRSFAPVGMDFITLSGFSPDNGYITFCTDCQVTNASNNTCASGGTGALAVRLNNTWRCFATQN